MKKLCCQQSIKPVGERLPDRTSDDIVKVDGNAYFPRRSLNSSLFVPSSHARLRLER